MKRILLLLVFGLVSLPFYAQEGSSLICINGLTITLSPGGNGSCFALLSATDILATEHFYPQPISYAIYRQNDVTAQGDDFTPEFTNATASLLVNSCDISDIYFTIKVYALDGDQVLHSCETYTQIEVSGGCSFSVGDSSIAGFIGTETGESMNNVTINGSENVDLLTDHDGIYNLQDISICEANFVLSPSLDTDPLNGVSTLDLIIISKHILGIQLLDSPYKLIAADINNSTTISILDLIALRRIILGIDSEFANNTSWRFIPTSYEFLAPLNPWFNGGFSESITISPLNLNSTNHNFIGIKMGDVNGSASTE